MTVLEDRSGAYMVAYSDYPEEYMRAIVENDLLDSAAEGAMTNINGKLTQQVDFPLGDYPGREATFEVSAQGSQPAMLIKAHYFLVNNRLYQVMVVAPQLQGLPAAAQQFFDSFKLAEN